MTYLQESKMATTADELNRIIDAKQAIKESVAGKGVEIPDDELIDKYSTYIDQISQQGGDITLESLDIHENGRWTAETGKAWNQVTVDLATTTLEVTANGDYEASGNPYRRVVVNVPTGGGDETPGNEIWYATNSGSAETPDGQFRDAENNQLNIVSNKFDGLYCKLVTDGDIDNFGDWGTGEPWLFKNVVSMQTPKTLKNIFGLRYSQLRQIKLNEGLEVIGSSAFAYTPIVSIEFPSTLTTIEDNAFEGCGEIADFHVTANMTDIHPCLGHCPNMQTITVAPENPRYCDCGQNILYDNNDKKLVQYIPFSGELPEDCVTIGNGAVMGVPVKTFTIPQNVTLLEVNSFYDAQQITDLYCHPKTAPDASQTPFNGWRDGHEGGAVTIHTYAGATGYDSWLEQMPEGSTIVEDL